MVDINRVPVKIGGLSATTIGDIIAGTVTITFGSLATNVGASASATIAGLTPSHIIHVWPTANVAVVPAGAIAGADIVTITGVNASATAVNEGATGYGFFAFRTF